MRHLAILALGLVACGTPGPVAPAEAPSPPSVVPEATAAAAPLPTPFRRPGIEPLPSGVYYGLHTYRPCIHIDDVDDSAPICTPPTHVVIAGVHPAAKEAERAARKADALDLAPGYPFVVHTDDLGIEPPGIAVVVGQHRSASDAEAWRAAFDGHLTTTVVALPDPETAFSRRDATDAVTMLVARIEGHEGEGAVTVYGSVMVEGHDGKLHARVPTHTEERGVFHDEPQTQPICELAPGTVVEARERDVSYYDWFPVTCSDGEHAKGWVRWKDTTLGTVVLRVDDHHEVIRLVRAECDSPLFETRRYEHPSEKPLLALATGGGCGS
jgi:hypothetical protein